MDEIEKKMLILKKKIISDTYLFLKVLREIFRIRWKRKKKMLKMLKK